MSTARAYAVSSATAAFGPLAIERRSPGPTDVQFDIKYCGVCHSDLHTARGEWAGTVYPCVPGHELVGIVTAVGAEVTRFAVGDRVGVGCMVDACRTCDSCQAGLEQYCDKRGTVYTYNSPDKHQLGKPTYGGYSSHVVVDQAFVLRIPSNLDLAAAAPLLCAGITTYSPLRHWGVTEGSRVGVVGLGGLGHMALKLAKAFGAHTTLFTTSPGKVEDARRLGADAVVISKDAAAMKAAGGGFDVIVNTVSTAHNLDPYINLLGRDGALVMLGAPPTPHPSPNTGALIGRRRSIAGSLIGGIAETQEMLDFCGVHGIVSDIEQISVQKLDEAYERMLKSDVKYRFVIDLATLGA
ncbi:MAG: NAD(P)-dependent alcohol dehydrogenase [Deltaproteobacteria bacterium]|nr:NAD(P)-dependent alcohol dehydrogenase [Deltaproteobacteria bacterium]